MFCISADETERITHKCNSRPNVRLPLVEWGMTEADCLQYCKERGYDWGGLYEKFGRVSCWCCPLQPLSELRVLYSDFPDLWRQLREFAMRTWLIRLGLVGAEFSTARDFLTRNLEGDAAFRFGRP